MSKLNHLFVDVEHVQKYHKKSKTWCYERLNMIRRHFELQSHERVNFYQFCEFEKLPARRLLRDTILEGLNEGT